jgi:CheY-like chemotaxis protein
MTDLRVDGSNQYPQRSPSENRYPLSGLRVLVVDDDAQVCQSLKDLLEEERCEIETAPSGLIAIERLDRQAFDVVLSDVVMPDMDGYQLYQVVKTKMPNLPVVLMTAFNYDRDHIIKRSCLEGLQGVIFKKPVNPVILKKLLLQHRQPSNPQPSVASQTAIPAAQNTKPV